MENQKSNQKALFTTKEMALTGLLTAIICVLAPFALNIPISPVPISLATLAIYFVLTIGGIKLGTISVIIYILLGLVGVPVFASFRSGPSVLLGPTGGYIIGYIFLALVAGFFVQKWPEKILLHVLGMILGTAACYLFGTVWFMISLNYDLLKALAVCVIPYIPGDIAKFVIALLIGTPIRKRLKKAGMLQ